MIVGLGKTGYACARYFERRGVAFSVMDDAENPALLQSLRDQIPDVRFGPIDADALLQAEEIVLSPGVPLDRSEISAARAQGIPVTGDISIFASEVDKPVIMITGSNGKSTETLLVAAMAKASGVDIGVGGNIGIPCLDVLEEDHELYVLEVSSYQLEVTSELNAKVAVVLNLSPDHMDRYSSRQAYYATKARIYRGCEVAIVNRGTDYPFEISDHTRCLSFGLDEPLNPDSYGIRTIGSETYLSRGDELLIETGSLKLRGKHNWLNCLAALAIGDAIGLKRVAMIESIVGFTGLPHRCEWLGSFGEISFYNDSKATNPGSTRAAIEGLSTGSKNIILILGGDSKDADMKDLSAVCEDEVRHSFVYGKDRLEIASVLGDAVTICDTLSDVVDYLPGQVSSGDLVLFSPACASFDQFQNYEHRGDEFKKLILEKFQ